jgi:hypothetical protein
MPSFNVVLYPEIPATGRANWLRAHPETASHHATHVPIGDRRDARVSSQEVATFAGLEASSAHRWRRPF